RGFTERQNYAAGPGPAALAFADLEQDGDADAVIANRGAAGGLVTVLRNRGDGTFDPGISVRSGDDTCETLAVADFTGDGFPDVAAGGSTKVTLLANDGLGGLLPPVDLAGISGAFCMAAAGTDLLVATDQVQVLDNDGTGTFTPGPAAPLG